jgi:hypothetical protein
MTPTRPRIPALALATGSVLAFALASASLMPRGPVTTA